MKTFYIKKACINVGQIAEKDLAASADLGSRTEQEKARIFVSIRIFTPRCGYFCMSNT